MCSSDLSPSRSILQAGEQLKELVTTIRDTRNKYQLKQKDPIKIQLESNDTSSIEAIKHIFSKQINAESVSIVPSLDSDKPGITVVAGKTKILIETEGNLSSEGQREKLLKDLAHLQGFLQSVEKKLTNERFVQNAKKEVLELEQKKKSDALEKIKLVEESLARLS